MPSHDMKQRERHRDDEVIRQAIEKFFSEAGMRLVLYL